MDEKLELKEEMQANIDLLNQMDIPEVTLYKKWDKFHNNRWYDKEKDVIENVKQKLWYPKNKECFENITPIVIEAVTKKQLLIWKVLRHFTCTAVWNQNPGRCLKFIVMDKTNELFLGTLSLGSDFTAISNRDDIIGWTTDDKMKKGMLRHTMMGSSIVPTQPFGYNACGGKLMALLILSKPVTDAYYKKYKETLVGVTTTSLYGKYKGFSQYSRLPYWKKCKTSTGKIPLDPSDAFYVKGRNWVKNNHPEKYQDIQIKGHTKPKIVSFLYKQLEVKKVNNEAPRCVYWCQLYENSNEFLRRQDKVLGKPRFDNSVEALTEVWKKKFSRKRVAKDLDITKPLFYDDVPNMSWNETKEKYLGDVGR